MVRMKSKSAESYDEDDEYDYDELKEKRREMRKLKIERDLLKMQAETEKMRQELEKMKSSGNSSNPDSQSTALAGIVAALIKAGVKPEQANEFLSKMNPEALAALASMTSNNPYLPVFLFLASQSRGQSPQSLTVKDVIELNKNVYDLAKDIGQSREGKGGDTSIIGIVKEMVGMVKDITAQQLLDKLDEIKDAVSSRGSIWDEILEDEKKFMRFKELFGGSSMNPEIQLKLEEMRQQHELNLKKLDIELMKLRNEMLESRRKTKMFTQSLRKIGEAVAEGLVEAGGEGEEYQKTSTATTEPTPTTMKCPKCGADIPNVKPGATVTCPSCKTTYVVKVKQ